MKKIKYIGGLPSGTLEDPITRQCWPFSNGEPIMVPSATADALLSQQDPANPDWVAA